LAETFGVKASTEGVIITGVLQNGPAAMAGIRPGDVITRVAGQTVGNVSELLSKVAALQPGTASEFNVQRGDNKVTANVVPGTRPQPKRRIQR
jgi:serine protease DegQ